MKWEVGHWQEERGFWERIRGKERFKRTWRRWTEKEVNQDVDELREIGDRDRAT